MRDDWRLQYPCSPKRAGEEIIVAKRAQSLLHTGQSRLEAAGQAWWCTQIWWVHCAMYVCALVYMVRLLCIRPNGVAARAARNCVVGRGLAGGVPGGDVRSKTSTCIPCLFASCGAKIICRTRRAMIG